MPSETLELVKKLVEAFNRQDLDALAELSDSELEFVSVLTAVDAAGAVFRGPDLWLQIVGKGKHSGVSVEQTIGITYEFRQGKLWRMRSYRNSPEALEAVGLSE